MKLLLQLADSLVEKGHAHATSIKSWVASVDKRYKDFSSRMEKYRVKLESTLGLTPDVSEPLFFLSGFQIKNTICVHVVLARNNYVWRILGLG